MLLVIWLSVPARDQEVGLDYPYGSHPTQDIL